MNMALMSQLMRSDCFRCPLCPLQFRSLLTCLVTYSRVQLGEFRPGSCGPGTARSSCLRMITKPRRRSQWSDHGRLTRRCGRFFSMSACVFVSVCMCIYLFIYTQMYTYIKCIIHTCICLYIYIYKVHFQKNDSEVATVFEKLCPTVINTHVSCVGKH